MPLRFLLIERRVYPCLRLQILQRVARSASDNILKDGVIHLSKSCLLLALSG